MAHSYQFRPEWLTLGSGFSWRSALALVATCRAAYLDGEKATAFVRQDWGIEATAFAAGQTQGLILETDESLVVAFRGSDGLADWLGNLKVTPRRVPAFGGSVHNGFMAAYEDVAETVADAVERAQGRALWLTGHSLGGALAVIAALTHRDARPAGILTFGQPRLLGRAPAELIAEHFGDSYNRVVNGDDIVARIPPGFRHAGLLTQIADENGLSAEDLGLESVEDPMVALDDAAFDALQARIRAMRSEIENADLDGIEGFDLNLGQLLDATVNAAIPGISAHRIEAYYAKVNARASSEIAVHGMHESFDGRRSRHFSIETTLAQSTRTGRPPLDPDILDALEGLEGVEGLQTRSGTGAARDEGPEHYLVHLAMSSGWTPPRGVKLQSLVGTVASVAATEDGVREMRRDAMVVGLEASREAGIEDVSQTVPHVKGTALHMRPDLEERGSAALVGIIDTGIDILHDAFADTAGKTRIRALWIQHDKTGKTPREVDPAAFTQDYGSLYLSPDIEKMRNAPVHEQDAISPRLRDAYSGHGTHVAGIAAGRGFADVGDGMAPEAGLVVVAAYNRSDPENPDEPRSIGYSSSHVDALAFLRRVALGQTKVQDAAQPMAINVSLGMNAGAHDGQTTLEAAFDSITNNGRLPGLAVVKSAGNERTHAGHASVRPATGALVDVVWKTEAGSRKRDYLEAWFAPEDNVAFTLVTPSKKRLGPVSFDNPRAQRVIGGNLCHVDLSEGHSDNGDNRLAVSIEREAQDIAKGDWRLEIEGKSIFSRSATVHIWAERMNSRAIAFQKPDEDMTLSVPGTARSVITVGACNARFPMRLLPISSMGLTRDGRLKPELCAPGEDITAAAAGGLADAATRKTGTSMAAPHVTGALALVFSGLAKAGKRQANARQLQTALTLTTQNYSPIHNAGLGHGILDAEKLFDEMMRKARP